MNKTHKILIVLGVLIILLPISAYVCHFKNYTISLKPSDWGPFGDYFGGILNPIISLFTLIVTIYIAYELTKIEDKRSDKIIETSYKPDLVIEERFFYSHMINDSGLTSSVFTYEPGFDVKAKKLDKQFGLNVLNVGLGPAKKIEIEFAIDIKKAVDKINYMFEHKKAQRGVTVRQSERSLHFKTISDIMQEENSSSHHLPPQNKTKINYLLPVGINSEPHILPIPSYILELYSSLVFNFVNSDDSEGLPRLPEIEVKMRYFDNGDKAFNTDFKVQISANTTVNADSFAEIVVVK